MLQTKKLWGCMRLKTGSFIIGVVSAACSLAALAGAEALAWSWQGRSWAEGLRWAQRARSQGLPEPFVLDTLHFSFSELPFLSQGFRIILHCLATVEAFHFNFCLMLLYGTWKERSSWIRVWTCMSAAAMALRVMLLVPISVLILRAEFIALGVAILMLTAPAISLVVYFVITVNNFHKLLISEKILRSLHSEWPDMT